MHTLSHTTQTGEAKSNEESVKYCSTIRYCLDHVLIVLSNFAYAPYTILHVRGSGAHYQSVPKFDPVQNGLVPGRSSSDHWALVQLLFSQRRGCPMYAGQDNPLHCEV